MMVDYSGMQTTSFLVPYTNVFYPESVKFIFINDLDIYELIAELEQKLQRL